jgi:hypothetical protein
MRRPNVCPQLKGDIRDYASRSNDAVSFGTALAGSFRLNIWVVSEMRKGLVHKRRQFGLMTRTGFGKGLLQLASGCGQSDAH